MRRTSGGWLRGESGCQFFEIALYRIEHSIKSYAHLEGEGIARTIVWRDRCGAGGGDIVRVILGLEHIQDMRSKRLITRHDQGAGRVSLASLVEGGLSFKDSDAVLNQRVGKPAPGEEVCLVFRDDKGTRISQFGLPKVGKRTSALCAAGIVGPRVAGAFVNLSLSHSIDVVEEFLSVAGGEIENGHVCLDRIFDRLSKVPLLRLDGIVEAAIGSSLRGDERDARGGRITDGLGKNPDHVVEVGGGAETSIPPCGVGSAVLGSHAGHIQRKEPLHHGGGDEIDPRHHQRVDVVVKRIAEWGGEHDRSGGAGLVVVVHDLREPIAVHDLAHVLGFRLSDRVEVAVIIVADVLLIKSRNSEITIFWIGLLHVPVGTELHSVWVSVNKKDDDVIQDSFGFRVVLAHHLIAGFDELLGAEDFAGVQTAIDPDNRLSFERKFFSLIVGEPFGYAEFLGDLLIPFEFLEIGRAGDDGHELVSPFRRFADGLHAHAVGFLVQQAPVVRELGVVGKVVVVPHLMPKELLRTGDVRGCEKEGRQEPDRE